MLQENEYQSMHTGRQLAKASKKVEAQSRMLQLASYVAHQYNNCANVIGQLQSKAHKASQMLEAKSIALTKLQIKLALLAYEKQLLEQRLKV